MRSLVVEDEFTSRMQLKYFLEEYGPCDIAVSGEKALEAFKKAILAKAPYSLICLDIQLPHKDGHQVLQEIRMIEAGLGKHIEKPVVVFMTTAMASPNGVSGTLGLCNEYLIKPIEKEVLAERLKKYKLL